MTGLAVRAPAAAEWAAAGVEVTLAATLVAILVVPFFVRSSLNRVIGGVALAGLIAAFSATFLPGVSDGRGVFTGLMIADPAATLWRRVLLAFVAGVVGIWFATRQKATPDGDAPEFFTLLIAATLGLSLMGATANLLMLLLATELASMPSYVLAGFRKTDRHAAEAALKYVLFGAACTAAMIYGLSLLYGVGGTLDFGRAAAGWGGGVPVLAVVGLLCVSAGLLFKISAVPAHFWAPDVFEGASVDVAAFLSVASKGAGVMLLARLWWPLGRSATNGHAGLAVAIAGVAVVTMTLGNFGALRQRGVKRLMAYSSIAHAGYMLAAMAVLPAGLAAVVIYLVVYAVMSLGAFAVLAGVEAAAKTDDVRAFDGLATRSPLAAAAMAVCLVSMVGLPPAAGFLAKWEVMAVLAGRGGVWWGMVAVVAINSVVSLAYYARVLRAMYFEPSRDLATPARLSTAIGVACAVGLVLMLVFFAPLDRWAAGCTFWQSATAGASQRP